MPLEPGTRLGPYEITAAIGAGGMGEVYQARALIAPRPLTSERVSSDRHLHRMEVAMYIPEGFGTVFPYIFASDAAAYLTFLERAFGADVVGRTEAPDGTVANARVRIGTTAFMVSEAGSRFKPSRAAFYIYVEDADQTHREALACGADDIHAPRATDYGDRQGGVTDPSGNIWWISTRVARAPYD